MVSYAYSDDLFLERVYYVSSAPSLLLPIRVYHTKLRSQRNAAYEDGNCMALRVYHTQLLP